MAGVMDRKVDLRRARTIRVRCSRCHQWLSPKKVGPNEHRSYGPSNVCKSCMTDKSGYQDAVCPNGDVLGKYRDYAEAEEATHQVRLLLPDGVIVKTPLGINYTALLANDEAMAGYREAQEA